MSEYWRTIIVDVEPRQKEFRIGVEQDSTAGEVTETLVERCRDEGVQIEDWAKTKIGSAQVNFVLMRKATGEVLNPEVTFESLSPTLENDEKFKLDVTSVVGSNP